MIRPQPDLTPASLEPKLLQLFDLSAGKIRSIEKSWEPSRGSPVATVYGRYASRGWTEWTQGFQFGSSILQFDATGDPEFLEIGRERTVSLMAPHVTSTGVHDHGFNNISTYGNLLRLMAEGRIPENVWERRFYELALKSSGAVQATRWSPTSDGGGFIYMSPAVTAAQATVFGNKYAEGMPSARYYNGCGNMDGHRGDAPQAAEKHPPPAPRPSCRTVADLCDCLVITVRSRI